MYNEKIPIKFPDIKEKPDIPDIPIRPRWRVNQAISESAFYRSENQNSDSPHQYSFFVVADNLSQVYERMRRNNDRMYPVIISVSLDGFYIYGEYFSIDELDQAPVDIPILLSFLR